MKKMFNSLCSKVTCALVTRKKENGDHLIEILGVILIAIIILFIFRDQIQAIFKKLLTTISAQIDALFNNGVGNV